MRELRRICYFHALVNVAKDHNPIVHRESTGLSYNRKAWVAEDDRYRFPMLILCDSVKQKVWQEIAAACPSPSSTSQCYRVVDVEQLCLDFPLILKEIFGSSACSVCRKLVRLPFAGFDSSKLSLFPKHCPQCQHFLSTYSKMPWYDPRDVVDNECSAFMKLVRPLLDVDLNVSTKYTAYQIRWSSVIIDTNLRFTTTDSQPSVLWHAVNLLASPNKLLLLEKNRFANMTTFEDVAAMSLCVNHESLVSNASEWQWMLAMSLFRWSDFYMHVEHLPEYSIESGMSCIRVCGEQSYQNHKPLSPASETLTSSSSSGTPLTSTSTSHTQSRNKDHPAIPIQKKSIKRRRYASRSCRLADVESASSSSSAIAALDIPNEMRCILVESYSDQTEFRFLNACLKEGRYVESIDSASAMLLVSQFTPAFRPLVRARCLEEEHTLTKILIQSCQPLSARQLKSICDPQRAKVIYEIMENEESCGWIKAEALLCALNTRISCESIKLRFDCTCSRFQSLQYPPYCYDIVKSVCGSELAHHYNRFLVVSNIIHPSLVADFLKSRFACHDALQICSNVKQLTECCEEQEEKLLFYFCTASDLGHAYNLSSDAQLLDSEAGFVDKQWQMLRMNADNQCRVQVIFLDCVLPSDPVAFDLYTELACDESGMFSPLWMVANHSLEAAFFDYAMEIIRWAKREATCKSARVSGSDRSGRGSAGDLALHIYSSRERQMRFVKDLVKRYSQVTVAGNCFQCSSLYESRMTPYALQDVLSVNPQFIDVPAPIELWPIYSVSPLELKQKSYSCSTLAIALDREMLCRAHRNAEGKPVVFNGPNSAITSPNFAYILWSVANCSCSDQAKRYLISETLSDCITALFTYVNWIKVAHETTLLAMKISFSKEVESRHLTIHTKSKADAYLKQCSTVMSSMTTAPTYSHTICTSETVHLLLNPCFTLYKSQQSQEKEVVVTLHESLFSILFLFQSCLLPEFSAETSVFLGAPNCVYLKHQLIEDIFSRKSEELPLLVLSTSMRNVFFFEDLFETCPKTGNVMSAALSKLSHSSFAVIDLPGEDAETTDDKVTGVMIVIFGGSSILGLGGRSSEKMFSSWIYIKFKLAQKSGRIVRIPLLPAYCLPLLRKQAQKFWKQEVFAKTTSQDKLPSVDKLPSADKLYTVSNQPEIIRDNELFLKEYIDCSIIENWISVTIYSVTCF
jgi:hypothetical protein